MTAEGHIIWITDRERRSYTAVEGNFYGRVQDAGPPGWRWLVRTEPWIQPPRGAFGIEETDQAAMEAADVVLKRFLVEESQS